jgi:hypothetical protein
VKVTTVKAMKEKTEKLLQEKKVFYDRFGKDSTLGPVS